MLMSFRMPSLSLTRFALVALALITIGGCDTSDVTPKGFDGGLDGGPGEGDAATDDGGSEGMGLLVAPEATEVGTLELDEPVTDVLYAEDLPIGLHADGGASILDMSDPSDPKILSALGSDGRIVGVAIDVQLRLLFVVTITGDLRVFRVSDPSNPTELTRLALSQSGVTGSFQGLVRVGYRLFVLGGGSLIPVSIQFGSGSSVSLLAEEPVALDVDPNQIATGAGLIYVTFAGGKLQVWSATSSPMMQDQGNLGANVVGLVARGHRLFVALRGQGLRVVDLSVKGTLRVLFDAPEFDDLEGLERFGNLILVSLSRGLVIALDLSDITAPRALVSRRGALPDWIAAIGGNLVLGGGTSLSVLGVPPFVAATLPKPMVSSFPRYGRVPLQLSKPIDPRTVTLDNVTLRCGGAVITGTLSVSLDNLRITFLPAATLPAGVTCDLTLQGVLDSLGLPLMMPQQGVSFTTAMAAPAPIENPKSAYPHTADGAFTDWAPGKTDGFEYFDVVGAQGMYSRFYADFDGEQLWMLNDWFYNGDDIDTDCYNQFGVWTGGGSEWWEIRAYGDQRIEVRLNGTLLDADDERVTGGYAFAATPNDPKEHTVYELGISTEPGSWGVQLHDPGPTFSCQQLETDPTSYAGMSTMDGSMIDPTQVPTMPTQPEPSVSGVGSGTPTLSWDLGQGAGAFTTFVIELSTGDDLGNVFFRTVVYGGTLVLPAGLLQPGTTYTFRLTAYNLIGSVSSEPYTFTVPGGDAPDAPSIDNIKPDSGTQGASVAVTINGEGFVQGARVYLDGNSVNTTFEDDNTLIAMLSREDTAEVGTYDLTVRNVPSDGDTESNAVDFEVREAQSDVVEIDDLDPTKLTEGVEVTVTVTLLNASDDTYTLVLTPAAGGDSVSFDCVYTDDACEAEVTLTTLGDYDATIEVGEGNDAYETDPLEDALSVAEASSNVVTLVSVSPITVTQSTTTSVGVTLTNGISGTYYLVLTPDAGGSAVTAACVWASQNHCDASVNLSVLGTYDAHVQVGEGQGQYDTNTVGNALTVSDAEACAHDECWPGARLTSGCSACATAVCGGTQACCATGYTSACVAAADVSGSCECTPPSIATPNPLQPNTQDYNATTAVLVRLQNEPNPAVDGYTFKLVLTGLGMSQMGEFDCVSYSSVQHTCTAQVSGLTQDTYNAAVQVTHTASAQSYLSAALDSAFTVTVPATVALTGLDPNSGSSGAYPINTSVNFTGGAVGNTYVLHIVNGVDYTSTCTVNANINQCNAAIDDSGSKPTDANYNVYLTVTPTVGDPYPTNTLTDGFRINAP
jgi:hypothetical protein